MPAGVNRPYNLVDILNGLNDQSGNLANQISSGGSVVGIGVVAETEEALSPLTDAVSCAVSLPPTWDNGGWGGASWN